MDALSPNIFEELGKYLDLKNFIALLSLSKGIRKKVLSSNIKVSIVVSFENGVDSSKTYRLYEKYVKHFTNVKVTLSNATDETVSMIIPRFGNSIYKFKTFNCHMITDQGFGEIAAGLDNLRRLDLTFCSGITDIEGLVKLIRLESLNLSHCVKIKEQSFLNLFKLVNLRFLDLSFCNVTDRVVSESLVKLDGLTRLILFSCKITDRSLGEIAKNLVKLQTLKLSRCIKITDQGLGCLVNLISLQTLDLSYCFKITNRGACEITKSLINLRTIDLFGCLEITKDIKDIIKEISKTVNIFNIRKSEPKFL